MQSKMDHPFPKSATWTEKHKRLLETVSPEDTCAILINADPDAMASAMALKRLLWRKVRSARIFHVNRIQRADNLAMIKQVKVQMQHIRALKAKSITRWALVDSQPHHHDLFKDRRFDIIIDHHPLGPLSKGAFVEVREEFGANATIMAEYLRAAKIKPAPSLATALFYGIKTDTDNFVRESIPGDINAFRFLYPLVNMNIIKKIESSEMTKETLESYRLAMDKLTIVKDIAYVFMGKVSSPDVLVIIADFFMRLAEATWCVAAGIHHEKVVVIVRNAGFRGDAGKAAQKVFGPNRGSAGGHKAAARAEATLKEIEDQVKDPAELESYILKNFRK